MTDDERVDLFLSVFKKLEKEVVYISGLVDDDFTSFSRALNTIYHQKKHPVLSDYDNYSFLRCVSDVRNILSHESDVCVPTEDFIFRLQKILDQIVNPLTVYDVCSKEIVLCKENESLYKVMDRMERSSFSHIPIISSENKVVGVFSRSSLFDYIQEGGTLTEDTLISDLKEVTPLSKHHNESYLFVSKHSKVTTVYDYMAKRKPHQKCVVCLFVSEHGSKDEPLLGVVTISDLVSRSMD